MWFCNKNKIIFKKPNNIYLSVRKIFVHNISSFFLWVKLSIFWFTVQKFGSLRNNLKPYFSNTVWTLRRVDYFFFCGFRVFLGNSCFLAIKTSINVLCFEVVILLNNLKIIRTELCGKVGLLQSLSFSHFWIGPFWSG